MAKEVFFRDVLRIKTSEFHEIAKEHSSDTNDSFSRSSGHSTSLSRRSADEPVCVLMMKNYEFHDQMPVDTARWTIEKQNRRVDAQ